MKLIRRKTTSRMAEANRANAKASTGPRTAEGIADSSRNTVKHGILAEKLPPGLMELNEDSSEFASLRDGLQGAFGPQGEFERLLVADMASIRWRLMRIRRAEAQLQAQQTRAAETTQQLPDCPLLLRPEDLDRLIRYEAHLERQFERKVQQFLVWRRTMGEPLALTVDLQEAQLTLPNES
ncbi:MAG: hypothetical protein LAO04_18130 [Acidobacteriia bacterium]|nr:hypothetical protein [Terriglobia bacterium]